jgi:hypothetical protein
MINMIKWFLVNSVCMGISMIVLIVADSGHASRIERLVSTVVLFVFFIIEIGFTAYFLLAKVD